MASEQEGSAFTCGSAFVFFGEMDDPFDPAAAERNFARFEEPFPPSFKRQRSVETLGGQQCSAATVTGDNGMWTRFVVMPVGRAKTRVLSCGDTAGSGRCLPMLKALAVDGLPERFRVHEGGAPLNSKP
jgi:hypothetical protein